MLLTENAWCFDRNMQEVDRFPNYDFSLDERCLEIATENIRTFSVKKQN